MVVIHGHAAARVVEQVGDLGYIARRLRRFGKISRYQLTVSAPALGAEAAEFPECAALVGVFSKAYVDVLVVQR
ncbi:hypothetical protein SDC9_165012 [bioreactor metagenome]|uniref:Uncharacterized protein n=1 Tax=bioreactor metagenome TaxID=1076179 RepID=A0A645FT66_9ZZZZ